MHRISLATALILACTGLALVRRWSLSPVEALLLPAALLLALVGLLLLLSILGRDHPSDTVREFSATVRTGLAELQAWLRSWRDRQP